MSTPVDIGTLIVSTPGTCGGRPRIADTRIRVSDIVINWRQGYSAEDIVDHVFTFLDLKQVHAALAYYFANQEAVDREILEDEITGCEGEADSLETGWGPPLSDEARQARIEELRSTARLLRSRLS